MDTEFNYLYEDKYYENAVKNLKSTFYDVVEREEIMLNNLEHRIAQEADEGVKARLLDLWSKQNDSLDKSIVLFRKLKSSVRVIDSFVKELSLIDEQIVSDIINNTNYIRSSRIQQMMQQDVAEQQNAIQEPEIVQESVETVELDQNNQIQEEVQEEVIENTPEEVVVIDTPVEEEIVETNEVEQNIEPQEEVEEVVEEIPEEEVVIDTPVEEVQEEAVETVEKVIEPVEESVEVSEESVEEAEDTIEMVLQPIEEIPVVKETDIDNILNKLEEFEQNNDTIKEPKPEVDIVLEKEIIEDIVSKLDGFNPDEIKEASLENVEVNSNEEEINDNENILEEENNSTEDFQLLIPFEEDSLEKEEESENNLEEVVIPQDNISLSDLNYEDPFSYDFEVPEMDIVNEEYDGMDLPNVVDPDKIDFEAIVEDNDNIDLNNIETNDKVVTVPNFKVEQEDTKEEDSNIIKIDCVFKENDDTPKAIIVNQNQFNKLSKSLKKQEKKLNSRGFLSEDLLNNTKNILNNNNDSNEHITEEIDQMMEEQVEEIPDQATLEKMIEQAAELYKQKRKLEAQALYEKISYYSDIIQEKKERELVKTA